MVRSHSGALDMGDNHPEGSGDPELEAVYGEVVSPQVGAVGIEELHLIAGSLPARRRASVRTSRVFTRMVSLFTILSAARSF